MKKKRSFTQSVGHFTISKLFGKRDDDDIIPERNKNISLRQQYLSSRGGLFSLSKFKSINCPYCEKAIVFNRYGIVCPYCDEKKFDLLGTIEEFLFDRCTTCRNVIKYFECPHCKEWITTDEALPQTNKVAYLQTELSLERTVESVVTELNNYGFNVEERLVTFLNGLFHDFDMKNEKRLTEKLEEAMKRNMLNYELLNKMTDIKIKQSKDLIEQTRVLLLQEGIKLFPALSPLLQTSILINVFGHGESKLDNLNFDDEMKTQLVKIKKEEGLSLQLENELKKWKLTQNINGL
jgi:transcription elongation factor Elf1